MKVARGDYGLFEIYLDIQGSVGGLGACVAATSFPCTEMVIFLSLKELSPTGPQLPPVIRGYSDGPISIYPGACHVA